MTKPPFRKIENPQKRDSALGSLLHSEHTAVIEKLVVGGDGLARLPYQDKSLVVFIPRTAPGDQVRFRITKAEKNHLAGEVVEILSPSPHRRAAPCPYFTDCGGCAWQHVTETEQLRQKENILLDLLAKFIPGAAYEALPPVASPAPLHYRNRIQLKQLGSEFGYFAKGSHRIVNIDLCLIAQKEISDRIPEVKRSLRPSKELRKFELRINHLGQFEHYPIGNDGEGLSFSQVNNAVNEQLVAEVIRMVRALSPATLTELYAGAGNFTFPLLAALPELRMESAELNPRLTAFATQKLLELRLQKRLFAFTTDCESFTARRPLSREMVLLDPPRAGCSPEVMARILESDTENILYISCHPVFLARDLKKVLSEKPEYRISHLQIFDMFPQTDHFETVVLLSRGSTSEKTG